MIWSVLRVPLKELLFRHLFRFGLGFVCCQSFASVESIYFLGNSFTWDGQPHTISTATGFSDDLDPTIGYSIYSGKSLSFIVDNPEGVVKEVGFVAADYYPDPNYSGNFETDLPGQKWDAVSIQPHTYGGGLFYDSEVSAAKAIFEKTLENGENTDTEFYVYGPWAFQESPDKSGSRTYSQNWLSGYSNSQIESGNLPNVRQAFRSMYWEELEKENPNVRINWIPVGEVLYRIDMRLSKGEIPGLSGSWDLFDQYGVHLWDHDNGLAGRYISYITTLSTVWRRPPADFQTPYEGNINASFKTLVDEIVWDTVLEFNPKPVLLDQFINLPEIPDVSIEVKNYQITATSSSGKEVSLEVVSGPAVLENDILSFTEPGVVTVKASQPGGGDWDAAPEVERSFRIHSIADTWRKQALGNFENFGESADLSDPDKDGIPNLFEYFLGTLPTQFNQQPVLEQVEKDSGFDYQFTQSSESFEGLDLVVEISGNMIDWHPINEGFIESSAVNTDATTFRIATEDLICPYFIRLNISDSSNRSD